MAETKRLVAEPILSHWLSCIMSSCIHHLFHYHCNTQDHLLAWVVKSKLSPWLRRQWMWVISTQQHESIIIFEHTYSFPNSLWWLHQIYSEKVQSEEFYWVQHTFYIWTLNLLYLTLCKAKKSDNLPGHSQSYLFPCQHPFCSLVELNKSEKWLMHIWIR